MKKNLKKAFTIIELIIAILIISVVLISGFQLFTMAMTSKVKIAEQTILEKNIFYFSEKLFTLVKKGGTLDYEEYFNRKFSQALITNLNCKSYLDFDCKFENGHFKIQTGFGNFGPYGQVRNDTNSGYNFGEGFYYCLSSTTQKVEKGCGKKGEETNILYRGVVEDKSPKVGKPQRYGQYSYQFIDYNSDGNDDKGDTNGDLSIIRDDDDNHLGIGPEVFNHGEDLKELYLISGDKKRRTYFRWNIKQDEFITDSSKSCDATFKKENGHYVPNNPTNFAYCRGTIEFLELEGKDWGMNHDPDNHPDKYTNDGVIDTWVIASNFSGKTNRFNDSIIAGTLKNSEIDKYWKPLFSDDINISDFKVFAYPNIDSSKVWNMTEDEQKKYLISPYVILSVEIKPSWKVKTKIKGDIKPIKFNQTINLTNIFSNSN